MSELRDFVRESNRIEGILRDPTVGEVMAHSAFLALDRIRVGDLRGLVRALAGADLRSGLGMDVYVGNHVPPPGGPHIEQHLEFLCARATEGLDSPYRTHVEYEALHPFMDGNGRSGRALWLWQMARDVAADEFALPFLHRWYYQSLDAGRAKQ
jgi:hypothetical protein